MREIMPQKGANPHHDEQGPRTVLEFSNLEQFVKDLELRIGDIEARLAAGSKCVIASKSSTTQATTDTYATITNWDTNNIENGYSFNGTTGELTFEKAGKYLVMADVQGDQTGNDRCQLDLKVQEDLGAGFVDNAMYQWSTYASRNTTQSEGGVGGVYFKSYAPGDKIRLQIRDVGVPMTIQEDEARLYVLRVSF